MSDLDMATVKLPTIPPVEAAKQLRQGIKMALKNWVGPTSEKMISLEGFLNRRKDLQGWWNSHLERRLLTDQAMTRLALAIETRRVTELRTAATGLRVSLTQERTYAEKVMSRLNSYAPNLYDGGGGGVGKQTLEHWNQLAQCLPTVEGLPQDALEMVVRAIVAILRANNIEGIEGVTHITANMKGGANGTTPASVEETFDDEDDDSDEDDKDDY